MKKEIVVNTEAIEIKTLCRQDPQVAKLANLIGDFKIDLREDKFISLIRSIIGQQLSLKAAGTISTRLHGILDNNLDPESVSNLDNESLRGVGISKQKIGYIRDLCQNVKTGKLNLHELDFLNDEEVIKKLTEVKGIGDWTAEMFLIFTLGRENVLSLGDISLQRACKWLYSKDTNIDGKTLLKEKGQNWHPYRTFASLYLWSAVNLGYVDKSKNIESVI